MATGAAWCGDIFAACAVSSFGASNRNNRTRTKTVPRAATSDTAARPTAERRRDEGGRAPVESLKFLVLLPAVTRRLAGTRAAGAESGLELVGRSAEREALLGLR